MANIQGFGIQLATGGFSLEANTIFATYAEALVYVQSSAAYVGKVISITSGEHKGTYSIEAVGADAAIKKLGSDIDLSNYVTKGEIASVYKAKGSVATFEDLPTNAQAGDVYNVIASGKNYVWVENLIDGESGWDDLSGIVDLSPYAIKSEVNGRFETIEGDVATNTGAIGGINAALAGKVDKVEGSSLIPAEKLALIDTNAGQIGQLIQADISLDGRIKDLESLFKDSGSGGTIDLGTINSQIGAHESRIGALESDNTTNKQNITALQGQVGDHAGRLAAIETVNTNQGTQLNDLSGRMTAVEAFGESISNLTATTNQHTQEIGAINQAIAGLAVKSVKSGDLVLAADSNGVLSTTIELNHYKDETDGKTYVALTGIGGELISRFDASDFVKDSVVDTVLYNPDTKEMTITWNTESGKQPVVIPMSGLVDTYTAGTGLTVADNVFAVRLSTSEKNKLTIADDGSLLVDLSEDITALEGTMDGKIAAAFAWIDVK